MHLSLDIIQEELKRLFSLAETSSTGPHAMELGGAAVLTSAAPDPHVLYVAEARRLPVHWKFYGHVSLILVGTVNPCYFQGFDVAYLCVQDNRFSLVVNTVLDIFQKYNAFDDTLKSQIIQGATTDALCNYVSGFLRVPLIIFDASLRLLYCSSDAGELLGWEQDALSGLKLIPTEFINQLNLVYRQSHKNSIGNAVLLKDDRLPYNLITTFGQKNAYNILAFETRTELTHTILAMVSHVNQYLLPAFTHTAHSALQSQGITALILSMLEGKKFSTIDLGNHLSTVNWRPDDTYCCIVLERQTDTQSSDYINTFCLKLENQFAACAAFPYRDHAVAVINLDHSKCPAFDISSRIVLLLRDGLMRAGISFKYWNFETTPIYYQQAYYAYEIGKLYSPNSWCYNFEDYALYYMLHYGSSRIPPRHLCHPALVHLFRYDQKNGTELLPTLETYVQCNCNAVTAANTLFIHRNTFYQRLNKILEIEDLNLEDSNERLYLQMSSKLISMYYYELKNGFTFPYE